MGYEINVAFDGKEDVVTVLLGQRREIDTYPRNIHTLPVAKCCLVLHFTQQIVLLFFNNTEFQIAVINENGSVHFQILHKVRI